MAMLSTEAKQGDKSPISVEVPGIRDIGERMREIQDLIERRAYEIYEGRGHVDGHHQQDWLQAESEVLDTFCVGLMEQSSDLVVDIAIAACELLHMQVAVEPERLVISGRRNIHAELMTEHHAGRPAEIFQVINFPVRVDPSGAKATFGNGLLEFRIPKAGKGQNPIAAKAA